MESQNLWPVWIAMAILVIAYLLLRAFMKKSLPDLWKIYAHFAGIETGMVAFPILVSVGHALFGQMGVSQAPSVGPDQDPVAWEAFMQSLSTLELLSATAAHIGGTFLAAAIAMLIAASRTRRPGIILGGFGLLGGVMNAMMLPGQPTWLMILDVALYVPAGWLAAEMVLRLKNRVA